MTEKREKAFRILGDGKVEWKKGGRVPGGLHGPKRFLRR
jgi:hypothetical protein